MRWRSIARLGVIRAEPFVLATGKTTSSPYLNRFVQPDTIIPDLSNPQSWNRYSYVTNQPIILDDPTGHCPGRKPGQKCATNPKAIETEKLPGWWDDDDEKEHIYVEGYGYFDTGHIRRGWRTGKYLMDLKMEEGGGDFPMVSKGGKFGDYIVNYTVSEKVTEDQITGVLYGIYTDFEYGYEEHQGNRADFFSSFTAEDLPSDHLGFWAAMNGKNLDDIPSILESLGKVSPRSGIGLVSDSFGIVHNYKFLPMTSQTFERTARGGGGPVTQMVNIPWPSWLQIAPIQSNPWTWQRK